MKSAPSKQQVPRVQIPSWQISHHHRPKPPIQAPNPLLVPYPLQTGSNPAIQLPRRHRKPCPINLQRGYLRLQPSLDHVERTSNQAGEDPGGGTGNSVLPAGREVGPDCVGGGRGGGGHCTGAEVVSVGGLEGGGGGRVSLGGCGREHCW